MAFLTDAEKDRISAAIRAVERQTGGELVTVIARHSDPYIFTPLLAVSLFALLAPIPFWVLWPATPVIDVHAVQLSAFVVAAFAVVLSPWRAALVPGYVKQARAAQGARNQFMVQGLHRTRDRTGVLIYVSVAERYVEILADQGINDKVDPSVWDQAVEEFTRNVKAGRIADGFLKAIQYCGDVLIRHVPRRDSDVDELSNRLIEI